MFGRSFQLFELFGIPIRIDLSWFVVAILIAWSLAENLFPGLHPGLGGTVYWWMGTAGALGLFVSIVMHELGHALTARRYGLAIRGITLFIFGGVAEMESEPPSARSEFLVAVAGPLVSVALGLACLGGAAVVATLGAPEAVGGVISYLAAINLILVVFNMIPAFPLDGGRVLRSALWQWQGDLARATRISSNIGSGFGMLLIVLGVLRVVLQQDLFGGMWMFLIGMFLRNAAQMSYRQLVIRRALEGEPVRRFMQSDPVTVPRATSVAELVENYVYRYHYKLFPVVDDGRLIGCVTTRDVKQLPREEWDRQTVGAIAARCDQDNSIEPDADALHALAKMSGTGASRLLVVEDGRLVGIIALKDMLKFLALKVELEGERTKPAAPSHRPEP